MKYDSKTASNSGMSAKLHCRAVGAPKIHFSWKRDESNITSVSEKYIVDENRVNTIIYPHTLVATNEAPCAYTYVGAY